MKRTIGIAMALLGIIIALTAYLYITPGQQAERKISGAYQALNLWSTQRAYPDDATPEAANYAAVEYARQAFGANALQKAGVIPPWETLGPRNLGGRMLAVAINPQNPNTVYAGSASGGLWRSTTGGVGAEAWHQVPTGFPVLGVSAIAIAPDDSNTIYIGTGEVYFYQNTGTGAFWRPTRGSYGMGVLKTTDSGQSWTKSLDWSYNQRRGVQAVKIDPSSSSTVWAATSEGTYRSTDSGASWTQVHNVIMATDLVIHPQDADKVVVACGNLSSSGHGLYTTTDGGVSWTRATSGVPATYGGKALLDYSRSQPNIVYASIGNSTGPNPATWLCKSTDFGLSWTTVSTTDYSQWQGWFSHDVVIHPFFPGTIVTVGINVWKSSDGGASLTQKTIFAPFSGPIPPGDPDGPPNSIHSDIHDVIFHPTDPNTLYFATDGGIYRSTDLAETFVALHGGLQTAQFYNGFAVSQQDSALAIGGLQDNGTNIYQGSTTWSKWHIGGDGAWSGIDATDDNIMYGSWQGLNLLKSTNGGQSFFNLGVPGSGGITAFIAPFVIASDNPQIIYAGRDIVYKSTNGGTNWTATNNGNSLNSNDAVFAMAVAPQNSNVVYAATAPFNATRSIWRTVNGGTSWTHITGTLPDRFITDLTVDPTDEQTVYVALSGFGSSHLFKSNDYGGTWQDIGVALPDVPHNAVIVDPRHSDHIYTGNDIGVFASQDGGATWTAYSEGLPEGIIAMDLKISPANRKLRVATHGSGVYQRVLLGDISGIADGSSLPESFTLGQNYPNPFNPTTTIEFRLEAAAAVQLTIFNSLGQQVRTLVDNRRRSAGEYTSVWDGRDDRGEPVASGVYIYQLRVKDVVAAKRMVLTR